MHNKKHIYSWSVPDIPKKQDCVLRYVVQRNALGHPDQTAAVFEDLTTWSNRELEKQAQAVGAGLRSLGLGKGDRVLSWMSSNSSSLSVWFGANWIGATYVPINPAYKGNLLSHVLENSKARVIVGSTHLIGNLADEDLSTMDYIVVCGENQIDSKDLSPNIISWDEMIERGTGVKDFDPELESWDEQSIIYTSGTTGPSKGVLSSYCHLATSSLVGFESHDSPNLRYLVTLPLFHMGGTIGVYGMLLLGRSFALSEGFSTQSFWRIVHDTRSTCCTLLGVMASFLLENEKCEYEKDNCLEWIILVPLLSNKDAFRNRFHVDIFTMFNMTEVSCPLVSERNPMAVGSCGIARNGVEARLVDEFDREVPPGTVGELIVRSNRPWSMTHGYHGLDSATAASWRNGWFHTGDGFRKNEQGQYFFVDRIKDSIRRRGENISSFEVESEVLDYENVVECAAVAVPSDLGEDDVMIVVATRTAKFSPRELISFLIERLPYFMIPRYIRQVPELPKTPTSKIKKAELRLQGITDDTWDREEAGISIKRPD